jgi:hypothetical protein
VATLFSITKKSSVKIKKLINCGKINFYCNKRGIYCILQKITQRW